MHENREISSTSWSKDQDRSAKAINRTADMHVQEKSDCAVVPVNQPNKEGQAFGGGWGGKGTDGGEHRSISHVPDTERETHVPGIARCAKSSKRKEAGKVHRFAPPSHCRSAAGQLLRVTAASCAGSRWRDMARSMRPDWRIDLSICTVGFIGERTGRNLQGESIFRKLMDGNVRWASRRWRTKSFNRPW